MADFFKAERTQQTLATSSLLLSSFFKAERTQQTVATLKQKIKAFFKAERTQQTGTEKAIELGFLLQS